VGTCTSAIQQTSVRDFVLVNNISDMTGDIDGSSSFAISGASGIVRAYGNVCLTDYSTNTNCVSMSSSDIGKNNIAWNFGSGVIPSCSGAGCVGSTNMGEAALNGYPFASSNPSKPDDFKLKSSSNANNAGEVVAGNLMDFTGALRDSTPNVGAFEGEALPPVCGDGSCNGSETCTNCEADCGACPTCGDDSCNGSEDCASCEQDCGACTSCGDGSCNGTEDCNTCSTDCGECVICGDGSCDGAEDCNSCSQDCGTCPACDNDGTCEAGENSSNCPNDCPSPSGNLIAHYTFDIDAMDDSGSGKNGTISGATITTGKIGNALSFDGVDDYVDIGTFDVTGSGLTLAAWVNADTFNNQDARIISKATGGAQGAHYFMLSTYHPSALYVPRFRLKTNDITSTLVGNGGDLTTGTWHHIAATYDGSMMKLYQDGLEIASQTKTGNITADPSVNVNIGRNPVGGNEFDGIIDDVRIYDVALTEAQIQEIITSSIPLRAGDLNDDYIVDIFDLVLIGSNFNSTVGQGHQADPSGDGECDVADLGIVARNFGNSY